MEFLRKTVFFRMRNALLNKAYIMNLQTFEALTAFCVAPFKVCWKERKLVLVRGKLRLWVTRLLYVFHLGRTLHFLFGLFLRIGGLQTGRSGEYGLAEKLLDSGWLGPIMCTILFRFEFTRKADETVNMVNETYVLEKEAEGEGLNTVYTKGFFGKAWQIYTYSAYSCVFTVPLAAGFFSALNPCEPAFISWHFLECNGTDWIPTTGAENGIVIFSGIIETSFWYQIIAVGTMANLTTVFYLALSLKTFITRAATSKEKAFTEIELMYWRRYQVYAKLQNFCLSHVISPTMICAWTTILIVGCYTLLRFFGRVSFALYTIHAQLTLNGLICLLTEFKCAGDSYDAAVGLLQVWKMSLLGSKGQLSLKKRWLKSCAPIKFRIGATNFFESHTPMLIGSFCVDMITNLILAENKKST